MLWDFNHSWDYFGNLRPSHERIKKQKKTEQIQSMSEETANSNLDWIIFHSYSTFLFGQILANYFTSLFLFSCVPLLLPLSRGQIFIVFTNCNSRVNKLVFFLVLAFICVMAHGTFMASWTIARISCNLIQAKKICSNLCECSVRLTTFSEQQKKILEICDWIENSSVWSADLSALMSCFYFPMRLPEKFSNRVKQMRGKNSSDEEQEAFN